MTAAVQPITETAQCKLGVVTMVTTEAGWEIRAQHRARTAPFTYAVAKCHCRTDTESRRRRGVSSRGYTGRSNIGTRPLCGKRPEHDNRCHQTKDHCESRGHEEAVRELFTELVRSYSKPAAIGIAATMRKVSPARRVRAGMSEREAYLAWLAEVDPEANNPYAGASS